MLAVYPFRYTEHEAVQGNPEIPDYSMHCQLHQSSAQSFYLLQHKYHLTAQITLLTKNIYPYNPYCAKYFLSHLVVPLKGYFVLTNVKKN